MRYDVITNQPTGSVHYKNIFLSNVYWMKSEHIHFFQNIALGDTFKEINNLLFSR